MAKETQKAVDLGGWEPVPGFVLCRPVKREELQGGNASGLSMPDKVGKVSDNVGCGEVVSLGDVLEPAEGTTKAMQWERKLRVGDLVGFMPYTDCIIEINLKKYTLVPYDKIRAVRRPK